jgi:hypothetical protein
MSWIRFHRGGPGHCLIASRFARALVASAFLMVGCRPPCVEHPWQSSFKGSIDLSSDPLAKQLGCGPVFQYSRGGKGFFGGTGSFCPDSPGNRAVLHANQKYGFPPRYCETCMGVPDGKIFVFWTRDAGPSPSCPSGCPYSEQIIVPTPPYF